LENVLAAICDLLRVRSGFITVIDRGVPHLEVVCGSLQVDLASDLPEAAWNGDLGHADSDRGIVRHGELFVWDGFWLMPLYAQGETGDVLGVVGISARESEPTLSREEQAGLDVHLNQAAIALVDRRIQQGVFAALERIIPEIEDIQRRRSMVHYTGEEALLSLRVIDDDEFRQWVWDALSHYWGGPNLTSSPLLNLSVVERMAQQYQGNMMQGLRAVLKEAIERLRPDGQREMTTPEWILYNILELKFLQGRKVRDIARRLAMSESDLYRKQRVAIENVAGILADMEKSEVTDQQATQQS